MNEIFGYMREYFRYVNKKVLALCTVQTAILIFLNYHNALEVQLTTNQTLAWSQFTGRFILFTTAFVVPYAYTWILEKKTFFDNKLFIILMVAATATFSIKMSLHTYLPFSNDPYWNEYWNQVYYWPARLLIVISILFL